MKTIIKKIILAGALAVCVGSVSPEGGLSDAGEQLKKNINGLMQKVLNGWIEVSLDESWRYEKGNEYKRLSEEFFSAETLDAITNYKDFEILAEYVNDMKKNEFDTYDYMCDEVSSALSFDGKMLDWKKQVLSYASTAGASTAG